MIELIKSAVIINKSFDNTLENLDFTKVVVNFYRRNHYINSLFYEKIIIRGSRVYGDIKNENRKALIANLVQSIHLDLTQNSIRESKLSYELSRFIQFIRWCDSNNLHGCLDNDLQCIDAFNSYVDYYWERVTARKYKPTTAFNVLNAIKRILAMIIQPTFLKSLPRINFYHQNKKTTTPPDDQRAAENVQLLLTFFNGICDFLIDKKKYPFQMRVPSFLNIENDCLWLFPCRTWCQTDLAPNGTSKQCINKGYNFGKGRIVTHEELIERGEFLKTNRSRIIKVARKTIARSNNRSHSYQKNFLATIAISSFTFLFIANTGMNPSQVLNITWDSDYLVEKENVDFRIIKHRANNKIVHFRISSTFLPILKRYIELRGYYLNNQPSQFFIPSFDLRYCNHRDLSGISLKIKKLIHNLGYSSNLITPREWRCLKSEWIISNTDAFVASKLLQNSDETIRNHYSSGTFTRQIQELGDYLEQLSETKHVTDIDYLQSTHIGGCKKPNAPIQNYEHKFIKANCELPEGCLFCENFLIHADKKDLQKLLSYKYIIEHTQHLSKTIDQWHMIYDPIIQKIDQIISQIEEINPPLVEQVKTEVYVEQSLDSYWSFKLNMLYQIGAI